jgi:hypothetical protein
MFDRKDLHIGDAERTPPLSLENALVVITRAWMIGRVRYSDHFTVRCRERRVTTIDVGNVIRTGRMVGNGEYCPEFRNWKYRIRGEVEGDLIEVVVALDPSQDYDLAPLIVVITVYEKI